MVLDKNIKTFVVHVNSLSLGLRITIHSTRKPQIAMLLAKKIIVLTKYLDLTNIFLEELGNFLLEQTKANEHAIKLKQSKQPPYRLIYSLRPIKLKILKIYIKTNLANSFIRASKLPASALIFFVYKSNGSLRLCGNYQGLNNLTIKNCSLLSLIK